MVAKKVAKINLSGELKLSKDTVKDYCSDL